MRGGRYRLVAVIGSGGMGTVWNAWDEQLKRPVALKSPHPMALDDPRRGRLLGEARLAASVSHPNLVEVFDVLEDEEGPFMVMELVDAPSLATVASELSVGEAVAVAAQVASALAAIHESGIVHRDVKPENVLVSAGRAKLVDFGIAKSADGRSGSDPTRVGVVFGTAGFTAPEVVNGAQATARSDVYSLGVLIADTLPQLAGADLSTDRAEPLAGLLDRCRDADPGRRPSAMDIARALGGRVEPTLDPAPPGRSVAPAGSSLSGSSMSGPSSSESSAPTVPMAPASMAGSEGTAILPPGRVPTPTGPPGNSGSPPGSTTRAGWPLPVLGAIAALAAVVGLVLLTTGGGPESVGAEPATEPSTTSTTVAPTTSASIPAATEPEVEEPPPALPSDPDETESLVFGDLAEVVGGSEKAEDAAEKIAEKIAEAHEATLEGEASKARAKLKEADKHARKDLDGDARSRAVEVVDTWTVSLGLSGEE